MPPIVGPAEGLSPEKFSKACKLLYEYESADFDLKAKTEGGELSATEFINRLFQIFLTDR